MEVLEAALVKIEWQDQEGNPVIRPLLEEVYISEVDSPEEVTTEMVVRALDAEMDRVKPQEEELAWSFTWEAHEFRPS